MIQDGKLKFGINIPQMSPTGEFDPTVISEYMPAVESLGYDSAWALELVFTEMPMVYPIPLLSYAAAFSSRVKLGTSVMVTTIRNPVNLAKDVVSLDQLCRGRLIFGVTIGSSPYMTGPFEVSSTSRPSRFEECLSLTNRLMSEDRVTHHGRFWQLDDLSIATKPVQKPHPPIWFGGRSDAALRRSARLGDGWVGAGGYSSDTARETLDTLRRYLEAEGRDPAGFPLALRAYVAVDADKKRASQRFADWFGKVYHYYPPVGKSAMESAIYSNEEECADKLGQMASLGIDLLIVNPVYDMMEQAERLAKDVLPKL